MKIKSLFLKGLIIGAGKIIPGVSGGLLAISLGVYEKGLEAVNHPIKNWKFIFAIGIGILVSVIMISKVIEASLMDYYLPTMLLFIGLIAGGISSLFEKVKNKFSLTNFLFMLGGFVFIVFISGLGSNYFFNSISVIFLLIMGIIDAFTMVVPGVSGTAIMILFGVYDTIIKALSNLTDINILFDNFRILFPFLTGIVLGTILFVKIMDYLFKKHNVRMYFIIIGLAISSTVMLIFNVFDNGYTVNEILVGLILFVIGYFLGNKLDELS